LAWGAVRVFFLISGAVLVDQLGRHSYPVFLGRRAARLWPVRLVAVAAAAPFAASARAAASSGSPAR
jgi:peptidoglycan/LPS O-acetylase OafA/YrhL